MTKTTRALLESTATKHTSKSVKNPTDAERKRPIKPTDERDAYTMDEFCRRHGISRGTYYNLKAADKGPVEMRTLGKVLISRESAEAWRREREAEALTEAQPA